LYFYHTPFRSLLEQGEMCEAPRARWQVERGSEVRESERDAHATHTRHVTMQGVGGPQSMHAQELVSGSAHPSFCITRSVLARAAGARGCSGRVTSHLIWITSWHSGRLWRLHECPLPLHAMFSGVGLFDHSCGRPCARHTHTHFLVVACEYMPHRSVFLSGCACCQAHPDLRGKHSSRNAVRCDT
jgi:hypothetical protein